MKTDREKLIELQKTNCKDKPCINDCFACMADHLLSHGVTFEKQGEWKGWGKGGTPTYENYGTCNVCHEDAEIYTYHRNYCPNCGARMKGAVNNE